MTGGEQERGFQKITMPKPPAQMSNCYESCLLNMRNDFQPHQNLNSSNIMRPTLTDCGGGGLIHCNTQKSHLVTFTQTSYGRGEDRSEQQRCMVYSKPIFTDYDSLKNTKDKWSTWAVAQHTGVNVEIAGVAASAMLFDQFLCTHERLGACIMGVLIMLWERLGTQQKNRKVHKGKQQTWVLLIAPVSEQLPLCSGEERRARQLCILTSYLVPCQKIKC